MNKGKFCFGTENDGEIKQNIRPQRDKLKFG